MSISSSHLLKSLDGCGQAFGILQMRCVSDPRQRLQSGTGDQAVYLFGKTWGSCLILFAD
jgi:hypothetical protein